MVIIAVDSVFQLILALNIAYQEFRNREIFLVLRSTLWNSANRLEVHPNGMVQQVARIDSKYARSKTMLRWQLWAILFPRNSLRRLLGRELPERPLAIIASTSVDYLAVLYRAYRRQGTEIHLVEEGLGEYSARAVRQNSHLTRAWRWLTGRTRLSREAAVCRFLLPDPAGRRFVRAPLLPKESEFAMAMLDLFDGRSTADMLDTARVIYFEQPLLEAAGSCVMAELLASVEQVVKEKALRRPDAVIKTHPRSRAPDQDDGLRRASTTTPWEALLPSINVGDKILISVSSTSIVTPKLMNDSEPVVICLFDLLFEFHRTYFSEDVILLTSSLFHSIKASYTDPSKFCIPSDLSELENAFSRWIGAAGPGD